MAAIDLASTYDGFLLDIDGVLVRGDQPLSGAGDALIALKAFGPVLLLSNNSSRSRESLAERLVSLGIPVCSDEIVPSNLIAASYLLEHAGPTSFWPVGEEGLTEELEAAGHTRSPQPDEAAWVVVGIDRHLTYQTLSDALSALAAGARLLATNDDPTFPVSDGIRPGGGAMLGALRGMGFEPESIVGKPSPYAYQVALNRMNRQARRILMIGDRLDTDIEGGQAAGLDTALVLTGVTDRATATSSVICPTWVAASLSALAAGDVEPGR